METLTIFIAVHQRGSCSGSACKMPKGGEAIAPMHLDCPWRSHRARCITGPVKQWPGQPCVILYAPAGDTRRSPPVMWL